jgi:hypothetical protein
VAVAAIWSWTGAAPGRHFVAPALITLLMAGSLIGMDGAVDPQRPVAAPRRVARALGLGTMRPLRTAALSEGGTPLARAVAGSAAVGIVPARTESLPAVAAGWTPAAAFAM